MFVVKRCQTNDELGSDTCSGDLNFEPHINRHNTVQCWISISTVLYPISSTCSSRDMQSCLWPL